MAHVYINGSMDIGEDEDEIAEALLEHGPLAIALNAFGMQFYHSGVSHPLSFLCSPEGIFIKKSHDHFRTEFTCVGF